MFEPVLGLVADTILSWTRIFAALALSIIIAWIVGILAARNRAAERVLIPIFDVLQAVPVLGFLPIILIVFVTYFPPSLGVEFAVIFLIFSGLGWSMAFAVYEAVRALPKDLLELADMEKMSRWTRITTIYIPASWSKVAYNSSVFWSAAVFYLASSEIFSLGTNNYAVGHGIGSDLAVLSLGGQWGDYIIALLVLIVAVALTRFLFLGEFALWSEKYKIVEEPRSIRNDPIYRFYSRVDREFRSRILKRARTVPLRLPRMPANLARHASLTRHSRILITLVITILMGAVVGLSIISYSGSVSFSPPNFGVLAGDEASVLVALLYSALRIWGVYALSVLIGLPVGVAVALNPRLFKTASPTLQVVSSIPAPVFLPAMAIFLAGVSYRGEIAAEFVIFLGMIWYIAFNVMEGVRSIPNEVWELAKLSKMKSRMLWRNIAIPAAFPSFITGSITAVGGGWSVLVVAEYFQVAAGGGSIVVTQVSNGVGKLLAVAAINGDFTLMSLALVSMTALIVAVDRLVWRRLYRLTTSRFSYNR